MDSNRTININVPTGASCKVTTSHMKILKGQDYCRMFSIPIQKCLADKTMTLSNFRVLMYFATVMDFDNKVCESQQSIAKNLDVNRQSVTKALRYLQDTDRVVILYKIGGQNIYMVNPNLFFKTRAINLSNLRDFWEEATTVQENHVG